MSIVKNNPGLKSPLQSLRRQTHALHKALEETAVARALLSTELTLAQYAQVLAVWHAAWQRLEQGLFDSPFAKEVPHLLPFPRAQLAQGDLAYLDSIACAPDVHNLVQHAVTRSLDEMPASLSGFIGMCYVLRGASLGGKVIAKHLNATLALNDGKGTAFFNAESSDSLSWVQWMQRADQVLLSENDVDAACRWACATFELLLESFSGTNDLATARLLRLGTAPGTDAKIGR